MTTPKIDTTNKVDQQNMGLSMKSSNPNEFPILYNDDVWDVVEENSALAEKLGGGGQFDQHQINEALAENSGGDCNAFMVEFSSNGRCDKSFVEIQQAIQESKLVYAYYNASSKKELLYCVDVDSSRIVFLSEDVEFTLYSNDTVTAKNTSKSTIHLDDIIDFDRIISEDWSGYYVMDDTDAYGTNDCIEIPQMSKKQVLNNYPYITITHNSDTSNAGQQNALSREWQEGKCFMASGNQSGNLGAILLLDTTNYDYSHLTGSYDVSIFYQLDTTKIAEVYAIEYLEESDMIIAIGKGMYMAIIKNVSTDDITVEYVQVSQSELNFYHLAAKQIDEEVIIIFGAHGLAGLYYNGEVTTKYIWKCSSVSINDSGLFVSGQSYGDGIDSNYCFFVAVWDMDDDGNWVLTKRLSNGTTGAFFYIGTIRDENNQRLLIADTYTAPSYLYYSLDDGETWDKIASDAFKFSSLIDLGDGMLIAGNANNREGIQTLNFWINDNGKLEVKIIDTIVSSWNNYTTYLSTIVGGKILIIEDYWGGNGNKIGFINMNSPLLYSEITKTLRKYSGKTVLLKDVKISFDNFYIRGGIVEISDNTTYFKLTKPDNYNSQKNQLKGTVLFCAKKSSWLIQKNTSLGNRGWFTQTIDHYYGLNIEKVDAINLSNEGSSYEILNNIIQFVGDTNDEYVKGAFYRCVQDEYYNYKYERIGFRPEENLIFCIEIGHSSSGEGYIFVNQPNYSILNNFVDNNNSDKIVPYVIYGNDIYQLANCVKRDTGNLVFDFSKNGDKFTLEYDAVYEKWTVTRTSINSSSTLDSNAYNNLGTITSNVTLELPEFESGAVPEFNGQFSIDTNSSYRVTFPIDVQCYGDTTQSSGHTYLFSIKNSICLILELTD